MCDGRARTGRTWIRRRREIWNPAGEKRLGGAKAIPRHQYRENAKRGDSPFERQRSFAQLGSRLELMTSGGGMGEVCVRVGATIVYMGEWEV